MDVCRVIILVIVLVVVLGRLLSWVGLLRLGWWEDTNKRCLNCEERIKEHQTSNTIQ